MKTIGIGLALTVAVLGGVALGGTTHRLDLTLPHEGRVRGVSLEAGAWKLELSPAFDRVTFLRGRDVVLVAPCRVEELTRRLPGDAVTYRHEAEGVDDITRIDLPWAGLSIQLDGVAPLPVTASSAPAAPADPASR